MPDLTLEFARKYVQHYTDASEKLIQASREAMDCYDCEAFLQLGIDAFKWLMRADFVVREAIYDEVYAHDTGFDGAIVVLCENWLKPCEDALSWVKVQEQRGYKVSNLDEFQQCCIEMQSIVQSLSEEDTMPERLAGLAEQAIQENRDGETAEFF